MAKDNHASYARIGFTVIIGVAAIVGALIYIGGVGDGANEFLCETYYDKSVSGLSVGSAVNFRGVKIGEVRAIGFTTMTYDSFNTQDLQRVNVVMALKMKELGCNNREELTSGLKEMVDYGLRATVTSSGITGLSRIELNLVENPLPPAKLAWAPHYPLIPPQPSLMDSLADAATKAFNQINKMDFQSVWSNIQVTASSAAKLSSNANALLETQSAGIAATIRSAEATIGTMNELATELRNNPSLLIRARDPEALPETR